MKLKMNIYEQGGVYGNDDIVEGNRDRLQKLLNVIKELENKPTRILDIGCGTGYISNEIKKIYPKSTIYGIDISLKALHIGKKKYKNINFKRADAEKKFSFKNKSFDLIISGEHIEHLKDPDTYLTEIYRILKDDGTLIITTPNLAFWFSRLLLLLGKQPFYLEPSLVKTLPIITIAGKSFPANLNTLPSGHLRLYTLNMLCKLLNYYKFKPKKVKGSFMFKNTPFKQIDQFMAIFPSFAFGLIVKAKKV